MNEKQGFLVFNMLDSATSPERSGNKDDWPQYTKKKPTETAVGVGWEDYFLTQSLLQLLGQMVVLSGKYDISLFILMGYKKSPSSISGLISRAELRSLSKNLDTKNVMIPNIL